MATDVNGPRTEPLPSRARITWVRREGSRHQTHPSFPPHATGLSSHPEAVTRGHLRSSNGRGCTLVWFRGHETESHDRMPLPEGLLVVRTGNQPSPGRRKHRKLPLLTLAGRGDRAGACKEFLLGHNEQQDRGFPVTDAREFLQTDLG